jgi:hypothetical protein
MIDGLWDLGLLSVEDPDLGTQVTLREEDLTTRIAAWISVIDGKGHVNIHPLSVDDINRLRVWLKKAAQNNLVRQERAKRPR